MIAWKLGLLHKTRFLLRAKLRHESTPLIDALS